MATNSGTSQAQGLSDARVFAFDTEANPWQAPFIEDFRSREVLGSGAFGSGKTRALTEKGLLFSIVYPGNRGLFARKTYSSLVNTTMETLFNEVLPESWVYDHNRSRHLLKIQSPFYPAAYCDACGFETDDDSPHERAVECPACESTTLDAVPLSEIYYDGLNTSATSDIPEKVKSLELGWVGVDEGTEITESAWSGLAARLRLEKLGNPYVPNLPTRQIFSATNPDSPGHWMYKRFFERGVGAVYESSTFDNLDNLPDDYLPTLRQQYGEDSTEAQRFIEGDWVGYEGMVYDEFSEATHVIEPLDVPEVLGDGWEVRNPDELRATADARADGSFVGDPSSPSEYQPARVVPPQKTPVVLAVDWGYRPDPCVVQFWARTSTHGWVLYRELFRTRTLPDDMAAEAMDRMAAHEVGNVKAVYADHDSGDREDWREGAQRWAEERATTDGVDASDVPDWRRLRTTNAVKNIDSGIKQVKREMRIQGDGDRPGIHFVRGALAHAPDSHLTRDESPTTTLDEIRQYGYEDADSGTPQSTENHGMDAMRYLVKTHDKKGSSGWGTAVIKS